MAIKLATSNDKIKVIVKNDSAVGPKADYEAYLLTLDESKLDLQEGEHPTRFVMRKVLPYRFAREIEDSQVSVKGVTENGDPEVTFNSSYMLQELRYALLAIEQHESVPEADRIKFELGTDGCATEELISQLHAGGWAAPLYRARKISNRGGDTKQKKS